MNAINYMVIKRRDTAGLPASLIPHIHSVAAALPAINHKFNFIYDEQASE